MRAMFSRPFWLLILLLFLPLALAQTPKIAQPNYITPDQLEKELGRQKELQDLRMQNLETKLTQQVENTDKQLEERKENLDRWTTWLNLFMVFVTLLVAVVGIGLPIFLTHQNRQQLELEKKEIEEFKKEIQKFTEDSKQDREVSAQLLNEIRKLKAEIETIVSQAKIDHEVIKEIRSNSESSRKDSSPENKESVDSLKNASDPLLQLDTLALNAERNREWNVALQRWQELADLEPNNGRAWFGAAFATEQLAHLSTSREEQQRLYFNAAQKYHKATEAKPDYSDAWYNWGVSLGNLGDLAQRYEEKQELYYTAIEKYEKSIQHKADSYDALYNWGVILGSLGELAYKADERQRIFSEEISKYAKSTEIRPNYGKAWYNWAIALLRIAATHEDIKKVIQLRLEAISKFQEAIKCGFNSIMAWGNITTGYLRLTQLDSINRELYLQQAIKSALKVEQVAPGSEADRLARAYALSNNEAEARYWLRKSKEYGKLLDCDHLRTEKDFDSFRETEWFKELLAEQCKEQA